jgi:hypothetical protein
MTRHDAEIFDEVTEDFRWSSGHEVSRVIPGSAPQRADADDLTWPSAVYPGPGVGYDTLSQHGQLTLNALLAPDLPRPMNAAWTKWPGWQYVWPGALTLGWSGLGFWAHSEPLHPLFAAGFGLTGTALMALGALGIAASNTGKRDAEDHPADTAGTRSLLGLGGAAWAGASASGAGFSGIGCMLAFGSLGAAYLAASGWKHLRRHNAIRAVIDYASASNPGPLPSGGLPFPSFALPENRLPPNPYEHRLSQALSAMKIEGVWFGSPMKVAEDTWRLPFELPSGANLSPEKLATKAEVIKSNAKARRIEVEPTYGARGTITVYDGPDRTHEDYPWDGVMATTVEKPFFSAIDDAGRDTRTDFREHKLITGRTRMGKSAYLKYLIVKTLECPIVRIGIDCKDGAPGLGMFEPVLYRLANDPMDGLRIQYGVKAIAAGRGRRMRERGIDEWDLTEGPRIIVIIDELAELTLRYPKYAPPILKSNLALVAASKITYVVATQTPSGPVFGPNTDARHQFGEHTAFRGEKEVSRMQFGATAERDGFCVDQIDGVGKFLVKSLAYPRPYTRKAPFVHRDTAVEYVERYAGRVEELDSMAAEDFEAGMVAFDEALAAGQDPLEMFEPPPAGGGGGRRTDSVVDSAQAEERRRGFRLITNYPGTDEVIELKHLALWNLLGEYGSDGTTAMELAAKQLDGFTSESNVRKQLRAWDARGFITSVKDGRAERWWRIDVVDEPTRKDA